MMRTTPIYLDYHASTPVDPRVFDVMAPYFCAEFGNASSRHHAFGWRAEAAVSEARLRLLELIGGRSPDEIVFTSGATESNNLVLRGVMEASGGGHIITSAIEHASVLDTCAHLRGRGVESTVVGVDRGGVVDPSDVERCVRPDTRLISIMAVNNEVGTIQPIRDIARIARRRGILFHTDASQALGRIDLDVQRDDIDLLSMSAHKLYGPKGVGALYVRRHGPAIPLSRQMSGGNQERGVRSGTLNVPGIVGFGAAARLAKALGGEESARLGSLRDRLLHRLESTIPALRVHGCRRRRVAANLNVSFGIAADTLLASVPDLAISGGAACSSGKADASHVLVAMGLSPDEANRAVRISLGRMTTDDEVERAAVSLIRAVAASS